MTPKIDPKAELVFKRVLEVFWSSEYVYYSPAWNELRIIKPEEHLVIPKSFGWIYLGVL